MIDRYRLSLRFALVGLSLLLVIRAARADDFQVPADSQSGAPPSAEEIADTIEVPDGFRATLFAGEPHVQQPIGIATDHRGRLWVAENYSYAQREINFDDKARDRIVILEDVDGDGRFDNRKVFWDGANRLTSVEIGFGGVFALCAPHLIFIPDSNQDDVPDGPPQVLLDGWDTERVRHNIVNGLRWGPDGWLYGRHGIQATSIVGPPGSTSSQRTPLNCCIWRYHPTRKAFEVVCQGTTNSWGFDYDDYGQMFFINTVIGHLWHVVPGAHYRRMYGADLDPHVYQLIDQTADHYHWDTGETWSEIRQATSDSTLAAGGGHAHSGLMIYLGDNWPAEYRGSMFTVNLHGRRINRDRLERRAAGYVGTHAPDFALFPDEWFRGLDLTYGPDGGVFVADWSDSSECHENDGVHRRSGRIYKLTYGEPSAAALGDLSQLDDLQLVELQRHANDWYVRQARRLLQERAALGLDTSAARTTLLKVFERQTAVTRKLRAMWCLYVMDAVDAAWLYDQTFHDSEHVRLWAVRLLAERDIGSPRFAALLASMARDEPSGLVRLFIASAMQRVPPAERWEIADGLLSHAEDADAPALPLMIWYGLSPAVPEDRRQAVGLAATTEVPIVRRHLARRLAVDIDELPGPVNRLLKIVASRDDADFQLDILNGIGDALRGRRKAPQPQSWASVAERLNESSNGQVRLAVRELGVVFGDGQALDELRKLVVDQNADTESRRSALESLIADRSSELLALLKELITDHVLSTEAIRGLAVFDDPQTPRFILRHYAGLRPDAKQAAIRTLASRPNFARTLLAAVERGVIPSQSISAFDARQMRSFNDPRLTEKLEKVWGSVRVSDSERKARIAELTSMLSLSELSTADAAHGRLVFNKVCANCHVLYGEGGRIGPDLTGANRKNLHYLLENIIDPSATMAADFKVSSVVLQDGRLLTGIILHESPQTITLQTAEREVIVPRGDVEEIVPQDVSLMPDGLLKPLTDRQIRDLVAYLSSTLQVPLPAGGSVGGP